MKTQSKFEEAYKRLNLEQRKAVDTIEGPVMVIAGPGTGKTEVLTVRIANIISKTDTPPEAILALTFTESGVTSMRKRLSDLIGTPAYRVTISTFHGFANTVIKNYPDKFPEIIGSTSIVEIDQIRILKGVIDSTPFKFIKPFGDKYYYIKHVLRAINELKRQGVSPDDFKKIVSKEKEEFEKIDDLYYEKGAHKGKMKGMYKDGLKHIERNGELVTAYEKYQKDIRTAKQYDYSDMIMYVMLALEEDEELRLMLQEAHLYFLVDEHQDTNDAQNKIIELLASFHPNPNLFVVGDEKQAIFRFQGASMANFYHFKNLYKNVTLISLRNNYRSTQTILDAAQDVSPRDVSLVAKAGHPETPLNLAILSSPEVEHLFIARKVKDFLDKNVKPEEIAILYRENRDVAPIARVLEKQGIPFNIESEQDVLSDESIKKLIRILNAIKNFGSVPELLELLHVDFLDIPPLDIYKLFSYCAANKHINPYNLIKSEILLQKADIEAKDKFVDLFKKLSDWKRAAENLGAAEAFETIVRDSGFLAAILSHPEATKKIEKLHALFEHLKTLIENQKDYTLNDFFDYLDLVDEQEVFIRIAGATNIPGRVRLMTAHKSKGQEFEYVFIINSIDGRWGSRRRPEHIRLPKGIYRTLEVIEGEFNEGDDERNLFYVALTRAKKESYITRSETSRDGREQLPTQFIQEIKEELVSSIDVGAYETEFAAHREMEFAPNPKIRPEMRDKEFLNALYYSRGLSVTALGNFIECPWKYFYLNLIRIPEAPNKHLMYGSAAHEAIRNHFDRFARGEDGGRAYLIKRFEEALARYPIKENDFKEVLLKGRKSLADWYDYYHKVWPQRVLNEFRVDGIELEPGTSINGKIDKIEPLEDGKRVNVVDYKTGKPKSRNAIEGKTKSSNVNYKRQLVFYRLLLDKSGKYDMVSGDVDFIEADDKGKLHKEHFEIQSEEVQELEKKILEVSHEIQSLAFWDKFCDDPDCRYCDLRRATIEKE